MKHLFTEWKVVYWTEKMMEAQEPYTVMLNVCVIGLYFKNTISTEEEDLFNEGKLISPKEFCIGGPIDPSVNY